ncbi:MAG TPA: prolipoprotein diacylglyceryl transferase [bacterium]|nr:prolipoprotein diacylglyceryl transferase [bacterium]
MLNWLTGGEPNIGGLGYNLFMVIGFAVWVGMTVRLVELKKDIWELSLIVIYSFLGAVLVPLSILLLHLALKGQLFLALSTVPDLFSKFFSMNGPLGLFKLLFKSFSLTAGVLALGVILTFLRPSGRRFLFPFLYPFPLFSALARLGCFSDGCCFGKKTDGIFGIVYPGGSSASLHHYRHGEIISRFAESLPVHPVQLYIAASMLILFIALFIMKQRGVRHETIAGISLLGYGGANFFFEFLRQEQIVLAGLTAGQLIQCAIAAVGLLLIRSSVRSVPTTSDRANAGTPS